MPGFDFSLQRRLRLFWVLCWWCGVSAFADTPPSIVYRVDVRDPFTDWIFQRGFRAWGQDTDLISHVTGVSILNRSSAFVSTTDHRPTAERIAMVRLQQGNPLVWIYEVRPTNAFYEVNASLRQAIVQLATRDGHGSAQMTHLESIESLYGHQFEWVTHHPILSESILSARAYRLVPRLAQSVVAPQMVEDPHSLRLNPNYRDQPSHANRDVWPLLPLPVGLPPPPMYSLQYGLRAVGLSWCAVGLGGMVTRLPRATSYHYHEPQSEPDCGSVQALAAPHPAVVWDEALGSLVERPVPWETVVYESFGHRVAAPADCLVQAGSVLKDSLMISCQDNPDYDHYVVRVTASGAMYTWLNAGFRGARTGRPWWASASSMPVHKTKWMLSDYHYSIFDVFSARGGSWYSQIVVAPAYPDLTYARRQKRSGYYLGITPVFTPAIFPSKDYLRQQLNKLPLMRK